MAMGGLCGGGGTWPNHSWETKGTKTMAPSHLCIKMYIDEGGGSMLVIVSAAVCIFLKLL